jgi:hypothetical protein
VPEKEEPAPRERRGGEFKSDGLAGRLCAHRSCMGRLYAAADGWKRRTVKAQADKTVGNGVEPEQRGAHRALTAVRLQPHSTGRAKEMPSQVVRLSCFHSIPSCLCTPLAG